MCIEDNIIEPREKEMVNLDVTKNNQTEELQGMTNCVECKEKFTEKNNLKVATGKCMMCSIFCYGKE